MDVTDNGAGIPEEDRAIVFDKFRQGGDTHRDRPAGTGLGLPITREIIDHLGGRLWVADRSGPGATLSFTLPVAEEEDHDRTTDGPTKGRVLIVDDEPNIVTSLEFVMRRSGFETAVARDGEEALAEVERFRPDLVLLDTMMPRRDGYEVCQVLRSSGWDDLKIVMLTAKGREAEVAKGLAVGADSYVVKPFSTRDLVEHVSELLGQDDG